MNTFKLLATNLPADIALLVEGNHGIGKSQGAYQVGDVLGLPVKELRLALMDSGDFIGLPDLVTRPFDDPSKEETYQQDLRTGLKDVESREAANAVVMAVNAKHGRRSETRFAPPSWLIDCSRVPHVLFLDEMNRALPEVLQASFQLILDRNLNGVHLHPQTRIIAAINSASQYRVESMDPALRDRFAIVELTPTFDDWITWARARRSEDAKQNVHPIVIDFISKNPGHFEHTGAEQDPRKVYPSRRSWSRLSSALDLAGCLDGSPDAAKQQIIHAMAMSMVGIEAAVGLVPHVIDSTRQLTAQDIIERFETEAELKKMIAKGTKQKKGSMMRERVQWDNNDALHGLNDRLLASFSAPEKPWTLDNCERFAAYFCLLPGEIRTGLWCKVMFVSKGCHDRIKMLAPLCTPSVFQGLQESGVIQASTTKKKT